MIQSRPPCYKQDDRRDSDEVNGMRGRDSDQVHNQALCGFIILAGHDSRAVRKLAREAHWEAAQCRGQTGRPALSHCQLHLLIRRIHDDALGLPIKVATLRGDRT